MAINLEALIIRIIIEIIVIAPSLWLAGRAIVKGQKARFLDAIYIVVAGVLIGSVFDYFLTGFIAAIIRLIIWLGLVKHYFDVSWGKAIVIAILAVVIFIVVSVAIALILGIAVFSLFT